MASPLHLWNRFTHIVLIADMAALHWEKVQFEVTRGISFHVLVRPAIMTRKWISTTPNQWPRRILPDSFSLIAHAVASVHVTVKDWLWAPAVRQPPGRCLPGLSSIYLVGPCTKGNPEKKPRSRDEKIEGGGLAVAEAIMDKWGRRCQ